jgi:hypothetical protein
MGCLTSDLGQKAALTAPMSNFRSCPESGLNSDIAPCPKSAAGSTGRCNTFRELVCWGLIEQGLSGPFIELPCYRAEFGLAT